MPASEKAKALNDLLHSDIRAISTYQMSRFVQEMNAFCSQRNYSQEYTEAWMQHRFRLYLTLRWLETICTSFVGDIVGLELGDESVVTDLLAQHFPQVRWQNVKTDLRLPWGKIANQSVDLLVCTEVLEHLSDLPEGFQDSFKKTGLIATLKECYRVLKPGGHLFITTPNASSVVQMINILTGGAPWFYSLHVREYTVDELITELKSIGFEVEHWRTVHCLTVDQDTDYSPIFQMLLNYHLPTSNRGDDIFLIARNP